MTNINSDKIEITQENYEKILELAKISNSNNNLCKRLGWKTNGGNRKKLELLLKQNNFDFNNFPKKYLMHSIFNNKEKLEKAIKISYSYTDVIKLFSENIAAGHYISLKKYIKLFNIDIAHFAQNQYRLSKNYKRVIPNDEIFIKNSLVHVTTVKKRILQDNLIEYKCAGKDCGITDNWHGHKITLQLEHKNGDRTDNRLENLEFLCPNCHSITLTWGSRNKKSLKIIKEAKLKKPTLITKIEKNKDDILATINSYLTLREILEKYEIKVRDSNIKGLRSFLEKNRNADVDEFLKRVEVNKWEVNYPEINQLIHMLKEKNFVQVGKELGCSDNAIRKYLKRNGIDHKTLNVI